MVPLAGPLVAGALRILESVVDVSLFLLAYNIFSASAFQQIALAIINLIPTHKNEGDNCKNMLSESLGNAIKAFS